MKHRDLNFLLIGVILTVYIFGFNSPLLPKFHISYLIPASWPEFLTAVGTVGTAVAAVFFGLGGKEYLSKPEMKLIDKHENKQASSNVVQGHTRLKFINDGKSLAKNVNVYIETIEDGVIPRGDFLPVPLLWTHDGNWFRNFPPQEIWFLDLCRKDNIANHEFPKLVLGPGQGVSNYEALYPGKTTLKLRVSDESGKIRRYKVKLEWQIGEPFVKVNRITEIYELPQVF